MEQKKSRAERYEGLTASQKQAVRKQWDVHWGENVSDEDCLKLDQTYIMLASEYKGAITQRMSLGLRDIARFRLLRDKAAAEDNVSDAKRYQEMIDKIMASEAMKANDAKPYEVTRVDAVISALEKKGAARNGKIIGKDELLKLLSEERGHYNTSLDVVDAIMLGIINTMRKNGALSELAELPFTAQVDDVFGELLAEPSEFEKSAMEELGVIPPQREGER